MQSMSKFLTGLFFLLILFQVPTSAQVSLFDSASVVEPSAINNSDLSGKMLLVKEQLKSANRKLEMEYPSAIQDVDTLLPQYAEFLEQQEKAFGNFKISHPNKQKVINLINKWGSYYAFLDTWQNTVNHYMGKNSLWLEQLNLIEKEWALTYSSAVKDKIPYEVRTNVLKTRNELRAVIKKVHKQNNKLLKLEVKILIQKEKINSVVEELEIWKRSDEFAVFQQRHPVIWHKSEVKQDKNQSKHFDSWASFKGNVIGVYSYLQSPENNVLSFFGFVIIMALWFLRLRKGFNQMPIDNTDKRLGKAKVLILNHLTPSVIFTITIFSAIYFSHTPNLLSELFLIVALLATIPLFKSATHNQFKGLIYFILLLYLMNTVKSYVWYSSIVYRMYLAMEAIIGIVIVAKYIFPFKKVSRMELGRKYRQLLWLSPLLYLLFIVAIMANVMGYTNFTDLLLNVAIEGSVLTVLVISMLMILGGLTTGTVYFHVSKLEPFDPSYYHFLEKRSNQLIEMFAYIFMTVYFLHIVDVYDIIKIWVNEKLTEPIVVADISFTIGSIASFFIILAGSYAVTAFISRSINGGILNFMKLPKGVPSIISVVVRYFLIAFAAVIALSTIGIDLGKFNLMAGALGLGIGFGLQNIISNFVSGLILIFERPVQTNDVVEVGNLLGTVTKIGVRSSNVRTFDGAEVVVPNSNFISNELINWTLSDNVKRVQISIGAAYGTDLQLVIDILNEAAINHSKVLQTPEPTAIFDQFGESSLDFRVRFWVPVDFAVTTKSEVSIAIYNAFGEAGISIPFPQRDVHINGNNES